MSGTKSILMRFALTPNPKISALELRRLDGTTRSVLMDGGYLAVSSERIGAVWDDGESHEVQCAYTMDGRLRYFYDCGDEMVELAEDDLVVYDIVFTPFAMLVHDGLNCRGDVREAIPGMLWSIGAYGQQRREVWLVRNWNSNAQCREYISSDKVKNGSVVIHIGERPEHVKLGSALIYDFSTLLESDGTEVRFDGTPIGINLKEMTATVHKRSVPKPMPKQEEHEIAVRNMLAGWFRAKYEQAKTVRYGGLTPTPLSKDYDFSTQKQLAAAANVPESSITVMKKKWKDDIIGSGWIYYKILGLFNEKSPDFIEFYKIHEKRLKQIGIEY